MGFLNAYSSLLVLHRLPWALWTFFILTPLRYGIAINTINILWKGQQIQKGRSPKWRLLFWFERWYFFKYAVWFLLHFRLLFSFHLAISWSVQLHTSSILHCEIFGIDLVNLYQHGIVRPDSLGSVTIMQKFIHVCYCSSWFYEFPVFLEVKNLATAGHKILA